jgi:homocysteine S-methyltransferase
VPSRPDPLAPLLARDGVVILDGGLATQLEAQGNDLADSLWSARVLLDAPGEIEAAHLAYFRAGARVAITASYQATFEGFAGRGIDGAGTERLLLRSTALADAARSVHRAELAAAGAPDPGPLLLAASVGPYGAMLADGSEYRGRYGLSVRRLAGFHRRRLEVLAGSGADLLACETIPELEEAEALVQLLDETPAITAWLAFTCEDGARLRSGAPVEEAVAIATASDAVVAIGFNCTAPAHIEELTGRARAGTTKPIVVYPNSSEAWDAQARTWLPTREVNVDPPAARRWLTAGATIIGGCCRVTPAQIGRLSEALAKPAP